MERDGGGVTCDGRLFHRRAAATGNALLPTVDSRVRRTARDTDEAERSRCLTYHYRSYTSLQGRHQWSTSFHTVIAQNGLESNVLNGTESWTLLQRDAKRLEAFEIWTWRRMIRISWTEQKTNTSSCDTHRTCGHIDSHTDKVVVQNVSLLRKKDYKEGMAVGGRRQMFFRVITV